MNFHQAYFEPSSELFRLGLIRTPGYPALIRMVYAVAGQRPWVIVLVQIAIGVATVGLVYVLAGRLLGPATAPWAALALAVDPISILLVNSVQPEVFFTLLLVGGSYLWVRGFQAGSWGWGAAAGIVFGIAALVRPIGLYLPAILIPLGLILHGGAWKRRLAFAFALLLAFSAPVGSWIAHNAEATGVPTLSTVESINLLYYRAAGALAEDEGISLMEARTRLQQALDQRVGPHLNEAERSQVASSIAVETLLRHPVGAVKSWIRGAVFLLGGPGRDELLRLVGISSRTRATSIALVALEFLVYGMILAGATWGVVALVRERKWRQLTPVLGVIVYFVIISSGPEAYSRFRTPMMPFLALLAGYGYKAVSTRFHPASRRFASERDPPSAGQDSRSG
jgi:4-amino-4-deoxy-L-arabinose transferase-like glycosyltransferase